MRAPILLPILVLALACGCTARRQIPERSPGPLVRNPVSRPAPANPAPATPAPANPAPSNATPGAFTSSAFGYQVKPPQGWQAAATGGNADPATSPDVFFHPPGASGGQDEYLAVRICRQQTVAACLPEGGARVSDRQATLGRMAAREVIVARSSGSRQWQETHTLVSQRGRIYDVMASSPLVGGENAQKLYPDFRESFHLLP